MKSYMVERQDDQGHWLEVGSEDNFEDACALLSGADLETSWRRRLVRLPNKDVVFYGKHPPQPHLGTSLESQPPYWVVMPADKLFFLNQGYASMDAALANAKLLMTSHKDVGSYFILRTVRRVGWTDEAIGAPEEGSFW